MNPFTKIDKHMVKMTLLITALIAIFIFSFGNQLVTMAQERGNPTEGTIQDKNGEPLNVIPDDVQAGDEDDKFEELGDLGDAPDSTNHSGTNMSAYPIIFPHIVARYPTVFDVSAPDASGPKHLSSREDAWLGEHVSLENDADLPFDEDGITNIIPPNDKANLDDFDDGVRLKTVLIPDCGFTEFYYDVNVPAGASLGNSERFVNVWFDYNRDGDWEDILKCRADGIVFEVTEWSVQNHIIVAGPGYHHLKTPNFLAMNPPHPRNPMWMRITLSGQEAPMDPNSGLASGRGPNDGYRLGETEDYYLVNGPIIFPPTGSDMTIHKAANPQTFEVGGGGSYILEVTNIGTGSTTGSTHVTDALPHGILPINVRVLPSSNTWDCKISNQDVICELTDTITPAESYTFVIEVRVTGQANQVVENCASVDYGGDIDYKNNESCVKTEVLSKGIYVSSSTGGDVSGIHFEDEDILVFNPATGSWAMYFDGSDVGLPGRNNVDAFHILDNGDILMSFQEPVMLNNIPYNDSDIVHFTGTTGPVTSGTFRMYLDGSTVQLEDDGEDIDAIGFTADGDLVVSTEGNANVPLIASDEDLIRLNKNNTWELYFDGSDVQLNANEENVWATWMDDTTNEIHLSTKENYNVNSSGTNLNGDSNDVFICNPVSLGNNTQCQFSLFWDGDNHGYGMGRIDGYAIGPMPTNTIFSISPY